MKSLVRDGSDSNNFENKSKNEKIDYSKHNKNRDTDKDPKYAKFYSSTAWKRFREIAFSKHGIYCHECLKKNRYVVADTIHHKVEVRVDFSKRFDIDNVIPVCSSCHNKIHEDIKSGSTKKVKPTKSYAIKI